MLGQPKIAAWKCPGCDSWIAPGVSVCPECKSEKNNEGWGWNKDGKPFGTPDLDGPGPILLVDEDKDKGNLLNEGI